MNTDFYKRVGFVTVTVKALLVLSYICYFSFTALSTFLLIKPTDGCTKDDDP